MNLKSRLARLECQKRKRSFNLVEAMKEAKKLHRRISALPIDELPLLSEHETAPGRGYAFSIICRAGIQPSDKAITLERASIEGMKRRAEQLEKMEDCKLLRRMAEGSERVLAHQLSRFNL